MELTTTEGYGKNGAGSGNVVVNVGSLVIRGKLAAITAETKWPGKSVADRPFCALSGGPPRQVFRQLYRI